MYILYLYKNWYNVFIKNNIIIIIIIIIQCYLNSGNSNNL